MGPQSAADLPKSPHRARYTTSRRAEPFWQQKADAGAAGVHRRRTALHGMSISKKIPPLQGLDKSMQVYRIFYSSLCKNPAAEKNHGCGQMRKEKTEKGKKNAAKCEKWLVYPGEIWYDVRRSGAGQRPLICGLAAVGPKACFCARRFFMSQPQKAQASVEQGIYDARTLGVPKMLILGLQHTFAMFGATVLVPFLTGLSVPTTLFCAGIGTLLFHLIAKGKVPAFLGSSFAFLGGILLGIPSLKLSGHYLAVTTIGFGFIVQLILINWIEVTHGSDGIPQIPVLDLCGISFDDEEKYFYFSGSMVVLLTWAITRLKDSRMGRAMLAVRQNEMAASTNGINVTSCKIVSFTLSSACAGLAGAMFAHGGAHYISPDTFSFEQSVLLLAMTVLGGDGSALGAVFGATLLTLLPESLRFLQESYMMFFAAAIVLIMIYMPGGVANLLAQLPQVRAWRKRRQQAMGRELAAEAGEPVCLEKPIQRPCPDSQVLQIRDLLLKSEKLAHFVAPRLCTM